MLSSDVQRVGLLSITRKNNSRSGNPHFELLLDFNGSTQTAVTAKDANFTLLIDEHQLKPQKVAERVYQVNIVDVRISARGAIEYLHALGGTYYLTEVDLKSRLS